MYLTEAEFGIIAGGYYCTYALMQIPLGLLSDRYDTNKILLSSVFICILGTLMLGCSQSMIQAYAGRLFIGLGSAAAFLTCIKTITLWFPPSYLPIVTGITVTLGTIGANIGGKPLALLASHIGWRYTFTSLGVLGAIILCLSWTLFLRINKIRDYTKSLCKRSASASFRKQETFIEPLKIIVTSRQAWLIGAFYFLIYTPLSCIADTWGVSYLSDVYQISQVGAANICLRIYAGIAIGTPIIGVFSNKIRSRRKILILCSFFTILTFLAIFYVPNLPLELVEILFVCLGFFLGGQKLVFTSICELMPKTISGVAIGFVNSICMLNGVFLPAVIGKCLSFLKSTTPDGFSKTFTFQDYSYAFLIPAGCLIAAFIISLFIKDTYYLMKK